MWRISTKVQDEKECKLCGKKSIVISGKLGVCVECLRSNEKEALELAKEAHRYSRGMFGMPEEPPRDPKGLTCYVCANRCSIPEGEIGFCGLVANRNGKLIRLAGTAERGVLEWYYDPLPTNCVAEFVCPGCTGRGYPKYAYSHNAEYGYYNLAVFYGACNLDCLFCQNWHYRKLASKHEPVMTAKELADKVYDKVSCVCYFGGDPSPQLQHALASSILMLKKAKDRIFRVCWETNGLMSTGYLKKALELSLKTGGCVKFDIKAWTPSIYKALTGCENWALYENIKVVGKRIEERKEPPLLVASTLIVPGYVDEEEVEKIASFLADIDPNIPYSLLAFHPDYLMDDLPPTSKGHMERCLKAAKKAGLVNVHIGNPWLLGDYY